MIAFVLRWFVRAVLVAGLVAEFSIYHFHWAPEAIRSDGVSYYLYLPSVVLHQSPRLTAVADQLFGGHIPAYTGILEWPQTSWWINPHPIGVAVLMLPFFLVAHLLTLWSNLPPDGFSLYYQIAAAVSGLVYGALGLALVARLLARAFPPGIVLATLASITFGTNLFHYMTFDATYSHAYSFFLVAALLWTTAQWNEKPSAAHAIALGAVAGMLVIVRHTNAGLLLIPALHGIGADLTIGERAAFIGRHVRSVALATAVAGLVVLPQWLLYHSITGSWLVLGAYQLYSETFHFDRPDWFGALFGVSKGLFFWSPLLLLSMAGLFVMAPAVRAFRTSSVAVLVVMTWLIASWFNFGGSYGHRGFTDLLPLFALPLASAYAWVVARSWPLRAATAALAVLATFLSMFQMLQYWFGVIPFNDTTWEL